MPLWGLLMALGLLGGFFSGLLGLGGSIITVPLLLMVPPLLGFPPLDMKQAAAISIVQVFFSSLAALIVHARHRFVSRPLVLYMGTASALAALAGGVASSRVNAHSLLAVFAGIATLGSLLMFLPKKDDPEAVDAGQVTFSRPLATALALGVGFAGGLVGAPGAFLYVPLLIHVLGIPTRVTLGSTLAIVLATAALGLAGKVATGQVPWGPALALAAGSVPGAQVGGLVSRRLRVTTLRRLVAAAVVAATVRIWVQVLGRAG